MTAAIGGRSLRAKARAQVIVASAICEEGFAANIGVVEKPFDLQPLQRVAGRPCDTKSAKMDCSIGVSGHLSLRHGPLACLPPD